MTLLQPLHPRPRGALGLLTAIIAGSFMACDLSVDPDTLGTGGSGGMPDAGGTTCPGTSTGCEDPGSNNVRIELRQDGVLNGNPIDPGNPTVPIEPGEPIEGTVRIYVTAEADDPTVVKMLFTPTWGERMHAVHEIPDPCKNLECPVAIADLVAPTVPGDYFIIFAADLQCAPCHIASGTYWQECRDNPNCFYCSCAHSECNAECMRWNDGNDLADLDECTMRTALETGYLPVKLWREGQYLCTEIGLTYVKLEVRERTNR